MLPRKVSLGFVGILACAAVVNFMAVPLWGQQVSKDAAERVVPKKLFMDKIQDTTLSGGLIRLPRQYIQGERSEIVIEAEEPTRCVVGNENEPLKTFGRDERASAGRYIAYLKQVEYAVKITRPAKLRVWYRAYFPTVGNWNHTERLDNGNELFVTDNIATLANDPTVNQWLWKKGAVYDFSAGDHIFLMDWQGGARLDQLLFLPENEEPAEGKRTSATYGANVQKGTIQTMPVVLRTSQKLRKLDTKIESVGGRVEIYLSSDQGKNWLLIPKDGDLSSFEFKDEKQLLFKYVLSAADNQASPLVVPGLLTAAAVSGVSPLANVNKDILVKEESICLTPSSWTGIRPDETGWKLAEARLPDDKGVIWLDAAQADQLVIASHQGSWIQEDNDAYCGKAIYQGNQGGFNLISFDIAVPAAVKCTPWFRIKLFKTDVRAMGDVGGTSQYFPKVGYQVDRNELNIVDYSLDQKSFPVAGFVKQEWIWVPGKQLSLDAGSHVFRMRHGFAYILLDRIALVCKDGSSPEGKGSVSPKEPTKEAEVVFHTMNTVGIKDIANIKPEGELSGSTITYFASADHGKTYHPLTDAASAVNGKSENGFTIKAVIKAGEKSRQLHINRFVAGISNAGSTGIELSNSEQKILFDGRSGMLTGWWTKKAGWIVPQGYAQSYFNLLMGSTGKGFSQLAQESAELVDIQMSTSKGVKTLVLKYALAEESVTALVQIDMPPTGLAQWNLKLVNRSPLDLKSIKFPMISGLRLGNDPEKNKAISLVNHQFDSSYDITGVLLRTPIQTSETYPGQYCMGWLSLYGDAGSFTAQVRDTDQVGTRVGLEIDPDAIASRVKFERLMTVEPGETRESHYALGFHEGDWHQSANYYSQWAHSWMDFSYVNTNWAKDADGWVAGWHFVSSHLASRYMSHLVPEMQWLGASYVQHFSNSIESNCSDSTIFVLHPKYGSLVDFRKAHAESAKQGVYHSYYTPSRLFTDLHSVNDAIAFCPRELLPPEYKMYPPGFGVKWAARDVAGRVVVGGYNLPTPCVNLCPASEGGHERLVTGIATHYGQLVGAQGVYNDEACGFTECYNTSHAHGKQYGLWAKGLGDCYKESLDILRKNNPDAVIGTIEGHPDQLLQYAEFGLTDGPSAMPHMFAFPEVKLLGQHLNDYGSREENARATHLFLRINRMGYTPGSTNDRQFFSHRKRIKDWMYGQRFMDDCGLAVSRPGIITKWFQREDAEHTGALINIQNEFAFEGATVILRSPLVKDAKFALAYLMEEEEVVKVSCENLNDGIRLAIPKAKASSILIPARFSEKEAIRAHLVWPRSAQNNRLILYVANMSSDTKNVSLEYALPAGIQLTNPPQSMQIQPMDVKRIEIGMNGWESIPKLAQVVISVKDRSSATNCSVYVAPVLTNGDFETDSAGKGTPDGWRSLGHVWFTHLLTQLTLPFDLKQADGVLDPNDPAQGKYSLRLDGKVIVPDNFTVPTGRSMWAKELRETRLKLAQMVPWIFNTGQLLKIKPETRYEISFQYKTAADDGVVEVKSTVYDWDVATTPACFPPQKVSAPKGIRSWQSYVFQFTTSANRSESVLVFRNLSDKPVWIDNVKVQEVAGAQ